jgi:hypothetical protein
MCKGCTHILDCNFSINALALDRARNLGHHPVQKHRHHRGANLAHLACQIAAREVDQQQAGSQLLLAKGFLEERSDLVSASNQQMHKPIVQLLGHTKQI